jgi:hypothetical protein
MIYLPLDKLLDRNGSVRATPLETPPAAPAGRAAGEMESVTIDGRARGER